MRINDIKMIVNHIIIAKSVQIIAIWHCFKNCAALLHCMHSWGWSVPKSLTPDPASHTFYMWNKSVQTGHRMNAHTDANPHKVKQHFQQHFQYPTMNVNIFNALKIPFRVINPQRGKRFMEETKLGDRVNKKRNLQRE